jgi:Bacterial TSP3 repeat
MITCSKKNVGIVLRLCVVVFALAACERIQAQKLDLNANGMSDVWEQIYNAVALDPNLDSDGDGVSNLQESLAGTNPFDANSVPRIPTTAYTSSNFSITLPSALGKQYQLQSVQPNISGWTNWTVETTIIARTGTVVTLTATIGSTPKFFRVGIADVDTDGDGLNDWEEYQLGLESLRRMSSQLAQPIRRVFSLMPGRLRATWDSSRLRAVGFRSIQSLCI